MTRRRVHSISHETHWPHRPILSIKFPLPFRPACVHLHFYVPLPFRQTLWRRHVLVSSFSLVSSNPNFCFDRELHSVLHKRATISTAVRPGSHTYSLYSPPLCDEVHIYLNCRSFYPPLWECARRDVQRRRYLRTRIFFLWL